MKSIINLIGKLNTATLAVFAALYIVCLTLVLIAVNPKYSYAIEPNCEHNTGYSEVSNSFQVIFIRDLQDNKVVENYSIRMSINSRTSFEDKTDKGYSIVRYQSEYMQTDNHEYYFDEVTNRTTSFSKTTYTGEGHEPTTFYSKLKYVDDANNAKTVTFKEKMLEKPTSLSDYANGNVVKFGDVQFIYQVVSTKTDGQQNISMRVVSTTNKAYHIDVQTWLLTEDNELLTFAGAYGLNNGTWNAYEQKVIDQLKAKAVVCKMIAYFDGEEFEMHYMAEIDSLKEAYSDFENVDAEKVVLNQAKNINKVIAITLISATFACVVTIVIICIVRVKKNKNKEKEA